MTSTTTIETVTVVRPIKVMAFACACISLILLIIAIASTSWLEAEDYRQGLWEECFTADGETVCSKNENKDWIVACAALCIIAILVDLGGTVLTGFGLATKNKDTKFKMYRIAMALMFLAVLCVVIALIVFPAMFMQEIDERGKPQWYFGWAYGVAWGAAIFLVGAGVLLLIDKEDDEIYYREKTYQDNSEA